MKFPHKLILAALLLFCGSNAAAVTNIAQALSAPRSSQRQGFTLLPGTVLVTDTRFGHLIITDGTNNLFVRLSSTEDPPQTGDFVRVKGTLMFSRLGPYLANAEVVESSEGSLPKPAPATVRAIASGSMDWKYITLEGVIKQARTSYRELQLRIEKEGETLEAILIEPGRNVIPEGMVNSRLAMVGVPFIYVEQGKTNRLFVVAKWQKLPDTQTTEGEPLKVTPISEAISGSNWLGRTVRVQGKLNTHPLTRTARLTDGSSQIAISLVEKPSTLPEEVVQIEGVLEIEAQTLILDRARLFLPLDSVTNRYVEVAANLHSIFELPPERARQGWPVYGEGTVTFVDSANNRVFLQGKQSAVVLHSPAAGFQCEPGDYVAFWGSALPFHFASEAKVKNAQVLREGFLPSAANVKASSLFSGRFHGQRIGVRGTVQHAATNASGSLLKLFSDGRILEVFLPGIALSQNDFLNADVRVRAVCDSTGANGLLKDPRLLVAKRENVRILEAPAAGPFEITAQPILDLVRLRKEASPGARVRIAGVVTCAVGSGEFFVQDESGGILVLFSEETRLKTGDTLEVAGFPYWKNNKTELHNSVYRHVQEKKVIVPRFVRNVREVTEHLDSTLVRCRGKVIEQTRTATKMVLLLQNENAIFTAEGPLRSFSKVRFSPGSLLELTGIAHLRGDGPHNAGSSLTVLLPTPSDVVQVQGAPLWTTQRVINGLAAFGGVILLVSAWVFLLRRQVTAQTAKLKENLQKEAALEKQFSELFEKAHDIVYSHDFDGKVLSLNPAGEKVLGYTRDEFLQIKMSDLLAPDQLQKAAQMTELKQRCGGQTSYELEVKHKDGHKILLEVSSWMGFENNKPVCVRGIARDITQRKMLEERLRHSQRMECVGQLAAGVAHDFNNLLTIIQGNNELSLMTEDLDERSSYSQEISTTVDKASNLVKQLLAFSRQQVLKTESIEINATLMPLVNMLRRLLGEQIKVEFEPFPHPLYIRGDKLLLEQAVTNLAVNARDAMPNGGVLSIKTKLKKLTPPPGASYAAGEWVVISVKDNGVGIAKEIQERIFDPFFTTKDIGKGTGLGLSMVYGTLKQHQGAIEVESSPGKGATFRMLLPVAPHLAHEIATAPAQQPSRAGTETIMLVEDERALREITARTLQKAGYEVVTAFSGIEALKVWRQQRNNIDLVLTDLVMPEGISGTELAAALLKEKPELRIIYTSGYGQEATARCALPEGAVFLAKPYSPPVLLAALRKYFDETRPAFTSDEPKSLEPAVSR